mgnify:FL=1
MKLLKTSRKYHKWLMLFLGIQFVIWSVSGAYMVILDIDYIHGDSLVKNHQTKVNTENINYSLKELLQSYPEAKAIELGLFTDSEVYRFKQGDKRYLVAADTGKQLSPLTESMAISAAKHAYTGKGQVTDVTLISSNPPVELSRRVLPAWRVDFADLGSPSIYISAQTGKVVTKRHSFWRIFDWMFSFHVMDYQEEDPANKLLFWFTLFALVAAIFGAILTYYRIFRASEKQQQNLGEVT